jgi:hypothetical protein
MKNESSKQTEQEFFMELTEKGYHADLETGIVWTPRNKPLTNRKMGWLYASIITNGVKRQYYLHRFVYWSATGECPPQIDHINRMRSDNRIENLRAADYWLNNQNQSERKGYTEVTLSNGATAYMVIVRTGTYRKNLGYFATPELALAAREEYKEYFKA